MVNVVALAQRPKTSTLIVDSDLDMGTYSINAAKVNNYPLKTDWTISPNTNGTIMTYCVPGTLASEGGNYTVFQLPPLVTMAGTMKLKNTGSSWMGISFHDVNGKVLSIVFLTTSNQIVTVPAGTNRVTMGLLSSASTNSYAVMYGYTLE